MRPVYRDGDIIVVSPVMPIRRGDRVVIKTSRRRYRGRRAQTPHRADPGAAVAGSGPRRSHAGRFRGHLGGADPVGETMRMAIAPDRCCRTCCRMCCSRNSTSCCAARRSARHRRMAGAYYAHPQNKFWKILHQTGLTPELLVAAAISRIAAAPDRPDGFCEDPFRHGPSGAADQACSRIRGRGCVDSIDEDISRSFWRSPARPADSVSCGGTRDCGEQAERIGETRIWILPSTSGAANGSWRPEVWHQFAERVRGVSDDR